VLNAGVDVILGVLTSRDPEAVKRERLVYLLVLSSLLGEKTDILVVGSLAILGIMAEPSSAQHARAVDGAAGQRSPTRTQSRRGVTEHSLLCAWTTIPVGHQDVPNGGSVVLSCELAGYRGIGLEGCGTAGTGLAAAARGA
jgi:hypothetical protein